MVHKILAKKQLQVSLIRVLSFTKSRDSDIYFDIFQRKSGIRGRGLSDVKRLLLRAFKGVQPKNLRKKGKWFRPF